MLKGVGKQIQQCWATLWQLSWNKRNVGSCFKLCATPPKNTQQHATGVQMGATGHIQQCFKLLANNLVSVAHMLGCRYGHGSFLFTMRQFSNLV